MDLIRLGSTYLPDLLIEGYESLIWTERYRDASEFELTTSNIDLTKATLPVDTLVSLRDTREVMIVESHSIKPDENGVKKLTTKGRSLETFLEQRILMGQSGSSTKLGTTYNRANGTNVSNPNHAMLQIWNTFVKRSAALEAQSSGFDVNTMAGDHFLGDEIPNVLVSDSTSGTFSAITQYIQTGYAYPFVIDLLTRDSLGIRCLRPNTASAKIFDLTLTGTTTDTLTITKTTTANVTKLLFDIYNGKDRSAGQTANPQIIFSYDLGHIDEPTYLISNGGVKNIGYITSNVGYGYAYPSFAAQDAFQGLKRRITLIDGGSDYGTVQADANAKMTQVAEIEVKKASKALYMDATINQFAPYAYGVDYFLGDKVTLEGEYSIYQPMWVSEYIRTEDSDGERGYPTLVDAI